jgi:hypothetical protein
MEEFTPMTDISPKVTYYLFRNDTLIKVIDDDEYCFDKVTEEWAPSTLLKIYKEKNISPVVIDEIKAKTIISNLKIKNLANKQELDFDFIEDLISEKKKFIVTNEKTNKSFEIRESNPSNKKKIYIIFIVLMLFLIVGNTYTLIRYFNSNDSKSVEEQVIDNITLKNIVLVKNTMLPNQYDAYIEENISKNMLNKLTINTENVDISTPGIYTYSIKLNNKEYIGAVIVVNNESEKNQTLDQLQNPQKYSKEN